MIRKVGSLLVCFLFIGCAANPPSEKRKIVTQVKIERVGSFLIENNEQLTNINETFWLGLKENNIIGFADPSERVVSSEGAGDGEREPFIINPDPTGDGAIRFFVFRDKELLGTIRMKEEAGETGFVSSSFYNISLTIKDVEFPE